MNTTHTLQQMQQLRLQGMHHAYHSQLELPMNQQLEGHDLVAQLVQSEQLSRANEKTAYYLKLCKAAPTRHYRTNRKLLDPQPYQTTNGHTSRRPLPAASRKHPCNRIYRLRQKLPGMRPWSPGLFTGIQNNVSKYEPAY